MFRAPGVVLINAKFPHNVGATFERAPASESNRLSGRDCGLTRQSIDASRVKSARKGYKSVLFSNKRRPFDLFKDFTPVCVEVFEQSGPLTRFAHPENAVYVFGPEDGVPQGIRCLCHRFVHIPVHFGLNLSAAVKVVLGHRSKCRGSCSASKRCCRSARCRAQSDAAC